MELGKQTHSLALPPSSALLGSGEHEILYL